MHNYIINASIQIIPIVSDKHPYEWVDKAISVIRQSGVRHEIGPFATILEGSYEAVMKVIHDVNEFLLAENCSEWISNVQMQIRSGRDITSHEKIEKFL